MQSDTSAGANGATPYVGLDSPLMQGLDRALPQSGSSPSAADLTAAAADNRELRAEIDKLRAEADALRHTQRRIMDLLGTRNPEKIVHDLRNVLNERDLFKALAHPQREEE